MRGLHSSGVFSSDSGRPLKAEAGLATAHLIRWPHAQEVLKGTADSIVTSDSLPWTRDSCQSL